MDNVNIKVECRVLLRSPEEVEAAKDAKKPILNTFDADKTEE